MVFWKFKFTEILIKNSILKYIMQIVRISIPLTKFTGCGIHSENNPIIILISGQFFGKCLKFLSLVLNRVGCCENYYPSPSTNTGEGSVGIGSQGNAAQVQCLYYGPPEKKRADSLHGKLTFPSETVGKYSEQHDS